MIRTDVEFKGVRVCLETDDVTIGERFEYECRYDHPLLKLRKKETANGRKQNQNRTR